MTDGAAGALLLHGLTGTPADLDPLASALRAAGFVVEAPLLPGHGGAPDLLAPVTRGAWREAADDALSRLRDTTGRPVAVLGTSMGALLATELAAARPGDVVLLSGTIGDHGVAVMSVREGLEFETTLESDTAPL
ncbi:MAG: alpha/beta fold hydrolase, partial [Vicinamibacteria bacterium]